MISGLVRLSKGGSLGEEYRVEHAWNLDDPNGELQENDQETNQSGQKNGQENGRGSGRESSKVSRTKSAETAFY